MRTIPVERSRILLLLAVLYLAIELLYVVRLPLVMDEFQGASTAHRLVDELPYRDFTPYKTVLGYYVQLPILRLVADPWHALLATKLWMALLTASVLALGAIHLARRYSAPAASLALAICLAMSDFLERSADLRVDMMTALAGFGGLLALLRGRAFLAGALSSVAFLISQKGIYFLLAIAVALAVELVVRRSRHEVARLLGCAGGALGALLVYLLFWSVVTSGEAVLRATFLSHAPIAFDDLYPGIRRTFWAQSLRRNPLFWALSFAAVAALARRARSHPADPRRPDLLASYGGTLLALGVWHRQPWPYFFVLLVPTAMVLLTALFEQWRPGWSSLPPLSRRLTLAAIVAFALAWPLARLPVNLARSSAMQASTLRLGEAILPPGEPYLAGVNILWRRNQSPARLSWLDQVRLRRWRDAPAEEVTALASEIENQPPRLLIANARLQALPKRLTQTLANLYLPLHGNLIGYAPLVSNPGGPFRLALDGSYVVESPSPEPVRIDGRLIEPGTRFELRAGTLEIRCGAPIRLRWAPELPAALVDSRFSRPHDLFPNVYSY